MVIQFRIVNKLRIKDLHESRMEVRSASFELLLLIDFEVVLAEDAEVAVEIAFSLHI